MTAEHIFRRGFSISWTVNLAWSWSCCHFFNFSRHCVPKARDKPVTICAWDCITNHMATLAQKYIHSYTIKFICKWFCLKDTTKLYLWRTSSSHWVCEESAKQLNQSIKMQVHPSDSLILRPKDRFHLIHYYCGRLDGLEACWWDKRRN